MTASRTDSTVALGAVAVDTGGSGWGGPGLRGKDIAVRRPGACVDASGTASSGRSRPVRVEPVVGALDARGPPPGRRHRPEPVQRLGERLRGSGERPPRPGI